MRKDMADFAIKLLLAITVSLIKILITLRKIRFNFKEMKKILLKLFECEKLKSHTKKQN